MQIKVTKTAYNGQPLIAESTCGRWRWISINESMLNDMHADWQMTATAYLKTNGIGPIPLSPEIAQAYQEFFAALRPIQKTAEEKWKKKKLEELQAELTALRPADTDRARKAREFDETFNEGGYGYNPYR